MPLTRSKIAEERKRKEAEERKRKEAEERKRKEAEEEAERKKKEAEEEAERKRKEAEEEAERKKKEERMSYAKHTAEKRQHSTEHPARKKQRKTACNYYVACTLFDGQNIAAKSTTDLSFFNFPHYLFVPDDFAINAKISVAEFDNVPPEQYFKMDHIRAQHRATKYKELRTPTIHNDVPAIVIQSAVFFNVMLIKVISEKMLAPAWVPLPSSFQPERYDIVTINEVELLPGTRIGDSYILPQPLTVVGTPILKNSPPGTGTTFPSRITSTAPIQFNFPWPDNNINNRKYMGLAMRALAVIEEEKHINNSYEGVLQKDDKSLFFVRTFDSVDKLIEFRSVWCCGINVAGRDNSLGTTLTNGFIIDAHHFGEPDDLSLKVVLNINKSQVNLTEHALTYTTPSGKLQLELKANEFFGDALNAVDTDTRQGSILRALLGIDQKEDNANIIPYEYYKKEGLNNEQCGFLSLVLNNGRPIVKLVAPPGTGKTQSIAHAAEDLFSFNPGLRIACIGQTNTSVMTLLEKVSARTQKKALLLQSKTAEREFADIVHKFRKFLSVFSVTLCEDLQDSHEREGMLVDKAKQGKRLSKQKRKELLRRTLDNIQPQIVYGTLAMMELNLEAMANVGVILVDEAGMAATLTTITIVANAPNIHSLVIAGDPRQLGLYIADIPPQLLNFGFTSVIELPRSNDVVHHLLRTSYRAHPWITECLSAAAYGDEIVAGVTEEERSQAINNMDTPNRQPIVIINVKSPEKRDPLSYSMTNTEQSRLGAELLEVLECRFPSPDFKIVCLCLYSHQAEELKKLRAWSTRITIVTVDGYQAQEANVVVLLTTRSKKRPDEHHAAMRFLNDDRRSIVALSRAMEALFIIGDIELLKKGVVWKKFIEHACRRSRVVGPDYIKSQTELIKREKLTRGQFDRFAHSATSDTAETMETSHNSSAYHQPQLQPPQFPAFPVQPFDFAGMRHVGGLFAQQPGSSQQMMWMPPFHRPPPQPFAPTTAHGMGAVGAQLVRPMSMQFAPPPPTPPQMSPIPPLSSLLLSPPPPPPPRTPQHAQMQPPPPPPDVPSSSASIPPAQHDVGDRLRALLGPFPHGPSPPPPPRSE